MLFSATTLVDCSVRRARSFPGPIAHAVPEAGRHGRYHRYACRGRLVDPDTPPFLLRASRPYRRPESARLNRSPTLDSLLRTHPLARRDA